MIINFRKNLPLHDEFTFTAIDFERANNSLNSICQVGICAVEEGEIVKSEEFLVKPPKRAFYFQKKATEIHGITAADVEDAPTFDEVWERIFPYVEGRPLAAHSFRDDSMALDAALAAYGIRYKYRRYGHICTLELAIRAGIHNDDNKYNLRALCELCHITLSPHHAGSDAEGCARLALKLAEELSINSLRDLAEFSQTPDLHEPELPELLSWQNITALENYLRRLTHKKGLQISDCPKLKDLNRAARILKKHPLLSIGKEEATSARELSRWLEGQRADSPAARTARKGGRRRERLRSA